MYFGVMIHEAGDASCDTESGCPGCDPGKVMQIVLNLIFSGIKKADGIESPVYRSCVKTTAKYV
jgi:hypothetical protein